MTKNKKFLAFTLAGLAFGAAAATAIAVPLTSVGVKSEEGANQASFRSQHLRFDVSGQTQSQMKARSATVGTETGDKWSKTVPAKTQSGKDVSVLVTTSFSNDRKFMPILAYDDEHQRDFYGYTQSRSANDVRYMIFPGWSKTNGAAKIAKWSVTQYEATEALKSAYPGLAQASVTGLSVDLTRFLTLQTVDDLVRFVNENSVAYLKLDNVTDKAIGELLDLSRMAGLRKLALQGTFGGIDNIAMPEGLLELEINSQNLHTVDPFSIPRSAALIHEQGFGGYFSMIGFNNGKHADMTVQELQEAVNIVYVQRIKERAFQGHFSGGYIYNWSLRGTKLTSMNQVTVPALDDGSGRFYMGRVEIDSGSAGVTDPATEVLPGTGIPTNDSQIGEWYDWNQGNGLGSVTKVIVSAIDDAPLPFNVVVQELLGFIAKYPGAATFDISRIVLDDGHTLNDVVAKVNEALIDPITQLPSRVIQFITDK